MKKTLSTLLSAAVLIGSMTFVSDGAQARGGNVAAGVIGGLAVGTFLGATVANRDCAYWGNCGYAYPPAYYAPPPGPRGCYYWNPRQGRWRWRGGPYCEGYYPY